MSLLSFHEELERMQRSDDLGVRLLATPIAAFVASRDPSCLSQLPAMGNSYPLYFLKEAARRDSSEDFLDFAAACIRASVAAFPVVRDDIDGPVPNQTPYCDLAAICTSLWVTSDAPSGELLAQAAARAEVHDEKLARVVMAVAAHKLLFGWTTEFWTNTYPASWGGDMLKFDASPPGSIDALAELDRILFRLSDSQLANILALDGELPYDPTQIRAPRLGTFQGTLSLFRPKAFEAFLSAATDRQLGAIDWRFVIAATERFDGVAIDFAGRASSLERLNILAFLSSRRQGAHGDAAAEAAQHPDHELTSTSISYLRLFRPDLLEVALVRAARTGIHADRPRRDDWTEAFAKFARGKDPESRSLLLEMAGTSTTVMRETNDGLLTVPALALDAMLESSPRPSAQELSDWMKRFSTTVEASSSGLKDKAGVMEYVWRLLAKKEADLMVFEPLLWESLAHKSKKLRELARDFLAGMRPPGATEQVVGMLASKSADVRSIASQLAGLLGDKESIGALKEAISKESVEAVRADMLAALEALGNSPEPSTGGTTQLSPAGIEDWIAGFPGKIKMPSAAWLRIDQIPGLHASDGTSLSDRVIEFVIFKQSKHKALDAAPDVLPLLAHIDREKSPPFALALVEGFLNSEQAASDRWALTLGGLLGDKRIIPPLLSRIPDWCENSRHKLAEYAAQAIALLPGNEPLMVLDSLSNRYRSKFKNVGKACAEAFNAAAAARGITADELGDMVVPDFGFDGDGIRRFEWDGGGASAELGADFKLSWFDPDTDKAWKSLPANAPAAVKDEVKTLGKLLREAVKAQTARLEMTLVRQRRWPVARWRELFENHPLLRSFASSLVWGIYDASGTLLRTFRRYPNGLLANAAGELEELPETDTMIGMVHPLELDTAALDAWRAHLGRFKVKQPFPQIDRPVELMDPLHGNRREIALTKGGKVSAGTFRSRSEKRGWTRGSVVDAGGISSYYKLYPGAGVEVVLPTDNFYIGIDPMETVELGAAYFAKAGSVERGSYTYDEPAPDDPRVLRFDQVPAVVWSETMSDLKAILGV